MNQKIWPTGHIRYAFFLAFFFTGCMKDKITKTYKISTPVLEVLSKFREAIKSQPAVDIAVTGKITVMGKYIYLSEPSKGIHVIDNSNPSSPKYVSFINIPGNADMAITGTTLYADAYGDLVTFDISNPLHVVPKNFATNVFPDHAIYYYAAGFNQRSEVNPDSVNVIIGYTVKDTTVDYDPVNNYLVYPGGILYSASSSTSPAVPSATKTTGTNGSTARFCIIDHFLYTVGNFSMTTLDISNPLLPAFGSTISVSGPVETIFPLKNRLYVGANNGMYMYDVQATPANPALVGQLTHMYACDPVISDGDYAYVTLNDSSACHGAINELQIIDIKDPAHPVEVKAYVLKHPVGLSKDGNNLFICDGKDGLKIYNAANVNSLQMIQQLNDAIAYDVIAQNGIAILVASNGIYQYDYSDLSNIHLISKL